MPELQRDIAKLPAARLDNLSELIQLLRSHHERMLEKPGHWIEGNIILGAKPKEYQPSRDEL